MLENKMKEKIYESLITLIKLIEIFENKRITSLESEEEPTQKLKVFIDFLINIKNTKLVLTYKTITYTFENNLVTQSVENKYFRDMSSNDNKSPAPAPNSSTILSPVPEPEPLAILSPAPEPEPSAILSPAPEPEPSTILSPAPEPEPSSTLTRRTTRTGGLPATPTRRTTRTRGLPATPTRRTTRTRGLPATPLLKELLANV